MKPEDKELLFKDLSARVPHGVIYQVSRRSFPSNEIKYSNEKLRRCEVTTKGEYGAGCNGATLTSITKVKPYLRPMSSMTEEEKKEYQSLCVIHGDHDADDNVTYYYFDTIESFDWLNTHHFDYRGLIDKGLAIEVTEENNPYKD